MENAMAVLFHQKKTCMICYSEYLETDNNFDSIEKKLFAEYHNRINRDEDPVHIGHTENCIFGCLHYLKNDGDVPDHTRLHGDETREVKPV